MGFDEVLGLLRDREAACRGEAERLRGEAERIAKLLTACEEELARLSTACQVVGELPVLHARSAGGGPAIAVPRVEVPGPRRAESRDAAEEFAGRVLEVLSGVRGPVRCRQVVQWLGLEVTARNVERVRHHLKRAAERGQVVRTPGGLFAPVRAAASRG